MSQRVEWADVKAVSVELVGPGWEINGDTTEDYALVLGADSLVVIEGSLAGLRLLAKKIHNEVWQPA